MDSGDTGGIGSVSECWLTGGPIYVEGLALGPGCIRICSFLVIIFQI